MWIMAFRTFFLVSCMPSPKGVMMPTDHPPGVTPGYVLDDRRRPACDAVPQPRREVSDVNTQIY